MKKVILIISALITSELAFATTTNVIRRSGVRPRRPAGHNGGIVERPMSPGAKSIGVINSQAIIKPEKLERLIPNLRFKTRLPLAMDTTNTPITIEVVDRADFGAITLFVEEFRAFVNVRKLLSDSPDEKTLLERVRKEIFRAAYMAMGSGVSVKGCMMGPVESLKDVDALIDHQVTPDAAAHIWAGMSLGIERVRFANYIQACQEGWAPAPTNALQKAIWDRVHQMPTEPIKIKPETKKVSE